MQEFWDERSELDTWKKRTFEMATNNLDWNINTAGLGQKLRGVKAQTVDQNLILECARWEVKTSPQPTFSQKVHRVLISLGARKVKRSLFGRA